MKYIFVIITAMFLSSALYAQVHFNVNLGNQPFWGHSGYNSRRVIIYQRQPVPYYVIYRNETRPGYESYPLQKHDNGKHKGWYKGNNGNSYNNGNGKSNGGGNDNGYYNNNGTGNYNGNSNENGKDVVPDKYNGNSIEKGNDVVPDKYK